MKLLTLNFLTCARKTCKGAPSAFPLHPREAELEQVETTLNPAFIRNVLPRLDWPALTTLANELGLPSLPAEVPEESALMERSADVDHEADDDDEGEPTQVLRDLHVLLMEMSIVNGKLACGNCGHEYAVKEGIANFLLPSHMV